MENFVITSRLTAKEYAKIMLIGLYKKPMFILSGMLGLYYIITFLLDYLKVINFYNEMPYFEICISIILLLGPTLIAMLSVKQFISNPSFANDIKYTFGENGITVEGITFKAEYSWTHIIKLKEIDNFLILHHTNKSGNFIDKRKLTADQFNYIKSKIKQK